jgi:phage-related minor tail protein
MLKKLMTIGVALGLILPGSGILAQTALEQAEKQVRAEKREMLQKDSQAAGEQNRVQEQTRTREEKQARDHTGDAKQYQKQSGQDVVASGEQLRDRDRDRKRDRDQDVLRDRERDRDHDRDRTHDSAGSSHARSGRR